MAQLKKLFEPIRIGNLNLKNRIKMTPMGTGYARNHRVTDQLINFYAAAAKGGAGLIGTCVTITRLNNAPLPGIYDDVFIPGLRDLVKACHEYTYVYAQPLIAYACSFSGRPPELVSPSGITITGRVDPPFVAGGPPPGTSTIRRPLEESEIAELIEAYGDGARRAREAGYDGYEIATSVGYLMAQFISPLTNKRTDKYGGSLENRMRFALETIENAKKKAGADWTYLARISGQWTENGITLDDLKIIAAMLEKAGVHAIDVMPGWHEDRIPMMTPATPQGQWAYIAEEVKKAVNIPIGAGTQIHDPEVANRVLEEGKADYVYMARPLIADPELPNKAKEGKLEDICPCIICNYCLQEVAGYPAGSVWCSVNPRAGHEREYTIRPADKRKNILVVGSGPAGMEAAIVASQRGHSVTLLEQGGELGGQLILATTPPHKDRVAKFKEYLITQIKKNSVKVELNAKVTPELVGERKPDLVIIAQGATPIIPEIPGAKGENVITVSDALTGAKEVGEKVVVAGGGMIGCETADFLAQRGKKVTLVEMLKSVARDVPALNRWHLIQRLREAGIRIETNVKIEEITDKGVKGIRDGSSEFYEADTVVLSVGMRIIGELANSLRGKVKELYCIGDCVEPRQIRQAMDEGFSAGLMA